MFQSRNRDACHFRSSNNALARVALPYVSISQSRFLSFQVPAFQCSPADDAQVSISQSRFLSFQVRIIRSRLPSTGSKFQSRNRDSCHFRTVKLQVRGVLPEFQSRNRDSCHFRLMCTNNAKFSKSFQSRNRDSCHFRAWQVARYRGRNSVSISQSRFLSFQVLRGRFA